MSWYRKRRGRVTTRSSRALGRELAAERGRSLQPVVVSSRRNIATSFWGLAWCRNLESYSDYANRLPRGRTYARNGSILDLQVSHGQIQADVLGSDLYQVGARVDALDRQRWAELRREAASGVSSVVELLRGKLSDHVMRVVTSREAGLLPSPREISFSCSCPDWAFMCKHVAAVLYGVGARLDEAPDLLFTLRGVDPADLVDQALEIGAGAGVPGSKGGTPRLEVDDLGELFGIDMEAGDETFEALTSSPPDLGVSAAAARVHATIEARPGLNMPQLTEQLGDPDLIIAAIIELGTHALIEFEGEPATGGYVSAPIG